MILPQLPSKVRQKVELMTKEIFPSLDFQLLTKTVRELYIYKVGY